MFVSLPLPYEEIKKQLSPEERIGIIFCNAGARLSGYAGMEGAQRLAEKLKKDGFNIVYVTICGNPCNMDLVRQIARNPVWNNVDTIIVSGCNSFYINAKKVFSDKKIVKAFTETYGNATAHLKSNTIVIVNPYLPALKELGIEEVPPEGLPFQKLLEAYMNKYKVERYPPW